MAELLLLGLAGLAVGAALSATRRHAPRALVRLLYAVAVVSLVLAVLTFPRHP